MVQIESPVCPCKQVKSYGLIWARTSFRDTAFRHATRGTRVRAVAPPPADTTGSMQRAAPAIVPATGVTGTSLQQRWHWIMFISLLRPDLPSPAQGSAGSRTCPSALDCAGG